MAADSTPPNSAMPADSTISSSEVPTDYNSDLNRPVDDDLSVRGTTGAGTTDGVVPETRDAKISPHPKSTTEGGIYRDSWLDEEVTLTDDSVDAPEDDFLTQEEQAQSDTLSGTTGAGVTEMDRLKQEEALIEMNKHDALRWPVGTARPMNDRLNITTIGTTLPEHNSIK